MDGLAISEIQCASIFADDRLDSEYVSKNHLILQAALEKTQVRAIGDFAIVTDGIHESIDFDENSTINLISAQAPKNNFFELSRTGFISIAQNVKNPRTQLQEDDVIVSTVGTIGNCAVVNKSILPANADRHVGIIRIWDSEIKPRYLSTFLLSKYGRNQTKRFTTGNVQPNLFIYKIKDIKVPLLSIDFQDAIEQMILHAEKLLFESKVAMQNAEELLICSFDNVILGNEFSSIKTLSDSFLRSGRLDAEYYQPKYYEIQRALHTTETVSSICKLYDMNFEPDPDMLYNYIELANVGTDGQISDVEEIVGSNLPSRARRRIKKGQVIVSSIEGSLSSCALVDEDYDGTLCSTGFYVVDSKKINSETLLVLFKSVPIQLLMKQRCSGTILTAISKDEFMNMPLPLVDNEIQRLIQVKVQESFRLRKEAKLLLDNAIKAVEMAIETDEATALSWLKLQF